MFIRTVKYYYLIILIILIISINTPFFKKKKFFEHQQNTLGVVVGFVVNFTITMAAIFYDRFIEEIGQVLP